MNAGKLNDLGHAARREGGVLKKVQQEALEILHAVHSNSGDEGSNISVLLWVLFFAGLACILFLPVVTALCWLIAAAVSSTHIVMREVGKQ